MYFEAYNIAIDMLLMQLNTDLQLTIKIVLYTSQKLHHFCRPITQHLLGDCILRQFAKYLLYTNQIIYVHVVPITFLIILYTIQIFNTFFNYYSPFSGRSAAAKYQPNSTE